MTIQISKPHVLCRCRAASALLATLATSASLLACGGGSGSPMLGDGGQAGSETGAGGDTGRTLGKPNKANDAGEGGAPLVNCDERPAESVMLNQSIWQTGFQVTLGTATLQPQTASCSPGILTIDAQFKNRGGQTHAFDARTLLSSGGTDYELPSGGEFPDVPGGRLGKGAFTFEVDETFSLDDATLSFGGASRHQAKVPFGENAPDALITLEPQSLPIDGKVVAGNVTLTFDGASILADEPWSYSSLAADEALLRIYFSATYTGASRLGANLVKDNFSLLLPDGTSVPTENYVNELADQPGVAIKDLELRFRVPSPSAGKYAVQARGRWGSNSDPAHADLAFALPSFPMFGDE